MTSTMRTALIVSGKAGGLQAMVPMMAHFLASGRWQVRVLLLDQHARWEFGTEVPLPEGVVTYKVRHSTKPSRPKALFNDLAAHTHLFERPSADICIVYGDRMDALVAATMANEYRVPIAHLQAGDRSGGVDHSIRYAVTALSDFAFCATKPMEDRLWHFRAAASLTFQPYVVGDHHLDMLKRIRLPAQERTDRWVVHLHPDTLATPDENRWMVEAVCDAVGDKGEYIMPCTDRMHEIILRVYEERGIEVLRYLPLPAYVALLKRSRGLIGNTSACVLDAPALGVPTILVGQRQKGRTCKIWHFPAHPFDWLMERLPKRWVPDTTYGDGEAGRRTFEILDRELA